MRIKRYLLGIDRLQEQPVPTGQQQAFAWEGGESWFDVQDAGPEELGHFLKPLDLHPLQMTRCLDTVNSPGVISFGKSLLMEYPAAFAPETADPAYLTILLHGSLLVTVRHGAMPVTMKHCKIRTGRPIFKI